MQELVLSRFLCVCIYTNGCIYHLSIICLYNFRFSSSQGNLVLCYFIYLLFAVREAPLHGLCSFGSILIKIPRKDFHEFCFGSHAHSSTNSVTIDQPESGALPWWTAPWLPDLEEDECPPKGRDAEGNQTTHHPTAALQVSQAASCQVWTRWHNIFNQHRRR